MGDSPFDPWVRARSAPDPFAESVEYCRLRLRLIHTCDYHVVARGHHAGVHRSYPSFTTRFANGRCGGVSVVPAGHGGRPGRYRASSGAKPNGTCGTAQSHADAGFSEMRVRVNRFLRSAPW